MNLLDPGFQGSRYGNKYMNKSNTQLKADHKFTDYIYWNLVAAVPFLTACVAIIKDSVAWLILYLILCILTVIFVYKFYCSHCPHYIKGATTTKCMFFWGIPKFFKSKPGPLILYEKAVSIIAPIIILLPPLYWLRLQPGLLIIYFLSLTVLVTTIRRNECCRCVYFHCPANCVPEDIRRRDL